VNLRTCAALASTPFLLANANDQATVMNRFLASTETGSAYAEDDFVQIPVNDTAEFLTSLKGCKKKAIEPLSNGGFGLQWKCQQEPKLRAAVLYFKDAKIARILPSTVSTQRGSSSKPIESARSAKSLTVLDKFADAVRKGLDTGVAGITPALTDQQRADLLSVQKCKVNLGAASTRARPMLYWVCGEGSKADGKVASLTIEADKIVGIDISAIVAKPTRVVN
jgi:hypothetical protein